MSQSRGGCDESAVEPSALRLVACFATSKAQAFATYTSLHYSGVLSGYSQTWKDAFDVGGGYCFYPSPDIGSGDLYYQCQGYDFGDVRVIFRL